MKRFGFNHYGSPAVFETIDALMPTPKANQALLHVLGFGLNPYDASLRRGEQAEFRHLKWPIVPGTDVLGRVVAVGAEVTDFAPGDLVMNYRPIGGYSEYVTASTTKLIKKPTALSFLDAAALPQVGIAAYTILHQLTTPPRGATIAIEGASGGVGSILVQMAKYMHLTVLASASSANREYLRQLGADEIASYDTENVGTRFAQRADIVINAINGGNDHDAGLKILKPGGALVTTAFVDAPPGVDHRQLGASAPLPTQEALAYLVTMAQTWGLSVRVAQQFAFTNAGVIAAHQQLERHHPAGKLVVMRAPEVLKPDRSAVNHL